MVDQSVVITTSSQRLVFYPLSESPCLVSDCMRFVSSPAHWFPTLVLTSSCLQDSARRCILCYHSACWKCSRLAQNACWRLAIQRPSPCRPCLPLSLPPHILSSMSVQLNPSNQLGFNRKLHPTAVCTYSLIVYTGPLTQIVRSSLTVTNHNSQPVGFKVKTTAPKVSLRR